MHWKTELQNQNNNYQHLVDGDTHGNGNKQFYKNQIKLNKYRIAHNLDPYKRTMWKAVSEAAALITLITILTIITAADMVASEFSTGTIKMLLIRPVRRWKILLSKYISAHLFAIFMLIVLFVSSLIMGMILYGFGGGANPSLYVGGDGQIHANNMLLSILRSYGFSCIILVMMTTLAFMISTVFRSSALAIGISIFLIFTGSGVVAVLAKHSWDKYILFANLDLSQYMGSAHPIVAGMTLGFSISVLAAYFVLFNVLSWLLFTQRDVRA